MTGASEGINEARYYIEDIVRTCYSWPMGKKRKDMDFLDEMVERYSADNPEFKTRYETAVAEMELIDQLVALRKAQKISQTTVADRMHTTQAAVSRMERQTDAKLSTIREYARAVDAKITVVPAH